MASPTPTYAWFLDLRDGKFLQTWKCRIRFSTGLHGPKLLEHLERLEATRCVATI
jgi:hypothetical protein